ncbi:MAG: DUF4330 domain-containing protein [Evtepia sp.]
MKLIDEKGKIFGKLNVIDLIVALAIVAVAVVLVVKLTGSNTEVGGSTELTYTVQVADVKQEVYEAIAKQDFPAQMMAAGDLLDAYVVSVTATPSADEMYRMTTDVDGRAVLNKTEQKRYDLLFTMKATIPDNVKNEVGTQEVRLGKTHIVKTANFELERGVILSCERQEKQ